MSLILAAFEAKLNIDEALRGDAKVWGTTVSKIIRRKTMTTATLERLNEKVGTLEGQFEAYMTGQDESRENLGKVFSKQIEFLVTETRKLNGDLLKSLTDKNDELHKSLTGRMDTLEKGLGGSLTFLKWLIGGVVIIGIALIGAVITYGQMILGAVLK